MKKLVSTVALLAALLFATSGYNEDSRYLAVGDQVPGLSVANADTALSLNGMKGKYILLTFWTTTDAKSRIDCNRYDNWVRSHDSGNMCHISVNLDEEPSLFKEIVNLDALDQKTQFNVNGSDASQVRHDFGLDNGYGSILIDPNGNISCFNPSQAVILSLI